MTNPWYKRYVGDYLRDTSHLSLAEDGAYNRLLDHYYATSAPLPLDIDALYRICRAMDERERRAVDTVVSQFFALRDDGYHNKRADQEIMARAADHEGRLLGARKTNEKRWGGRSAIRSASRSSVGNPDTRSQIPDKDLKSIPSAKTAEDPSSGEFEAFWDSYPRKVDKQSAKRAWVKNFCEGHLEEILASLAAWKATSQFADPKFIPYAATWINKGRHKEIPTREVNSNANPGAVKPTAGKYDGLKNTVIAIA